MLFVLGHMVGNLKIYLGADALNTYSHWLRDVGEPAVPREVLLWIVRIVLLVASSLHIDSACAAGALQPPARPVGYEAEPRVRGGGLRQPHDALDRADHRPLRGLPPARPDVGHGEPRLPLRATLPNVVASFQRVPVAIVYIVANLALAVHLYHGSWSLFQTMGWTWPRHNELAPVLRDRVRDGHRDREHLVPDRGRTRGGELMIDLEANIPPGPIQEAWDNHSFNVPAGQRGEQAPLPRHRRRHRAGRRLGRGDARRARLPGRAPSCFHDSPRRAHSIAAQGGINAAKNYQQRRRQRLPPLLRHDQGRRLPLPRGERLPARADVERTSSTSASRRACRSRASTAACSTTAPSAARRCRARSTPAARPASSCCSAPTRRCSRQVDAGTRRRCTRARRCSTSSSTTGARAASSSATSSPARSARTPRTRSCSPRAATATSSSSRPTPRRSQRHRDLAGAPAGRAVRQPVLHADPPDLHPGSRTTSSRS